ncbi:MAG: TonB-dependent receptor [Alistipes sp.]|nr:TonB-dependent receptor [Alistipes sp.]MBR2014161.1 TonB-dependent receptor [Alistipes sp.]
MRRFFLLSLVLLMATSVMAMSRVTGRVVDVEGKPIGYATVMAMQGEDVVRGVATDDEGGFVLQLQDGSYNILVEFVGYEAWQQSVSVAGDVDLGEITLKESSTEIGEVVVEAEMITREADRFVVNVAASEQAVGKDGEELLKQSPGVKVDDDEISILGASGTKVYVNGREMKLSGRDLVNYVKGLRAENIQKIEIVPQTGADYDANSSGGMIMISLRKRLDDGLMGSVNFSTAQSGLGSSYSPNISMNAHVGKFDLSASGWFYNFDQDQSIDERTRYLQSLTNIDSETDIDIGGSYGGGSLSAIMQINDKHSVGASLDYNGGKFDTDSKSSTAYTVLSDASLSTLTRSGYTNADKNNSYTATVNYIYKTDEMGSTLKVIGDFTHRKDNGWQDGLTKYEQPQGKADSLYRYDNGNLYRVATASIDRQKMFAPTMSLKYGAKYTWNDVNSDAIYRYQKDEQWVPSTVEDFDISYTENIAALYGVLSMRKGKWGLVAGLRGEYTSTTGKGDVGQDYFSLFPNANVSYMLDKMGQYSLVAQYSRTISRPNFWNLSPSRMQISDYSYQMGNPELDPSYVNNFSLTAVMKYKYSVTLMLSTTKDAIQQMIVPDAEDERMLCIGQVNMPRLNRYALSVNLPFTPTKWWSWNVNLFGMIQEQKLTPESPKTTTEMLNWNSMMTFTLPKQFYVDVNYYGMTDMTVGNMTISTMHFMGVTLKKRIKDEWTLTCGFQNIIPIDMGLTTVQNDFTRTLEQKNFNQRFNVRLGVSYSFATGKQFRSRSVERGDDGSRLQGGNNQGQGQ